MGVTLTAVGVLLAAVFAWFVWPPLVLLVLAGACLAAGLLVDWEAMHGDPAKTPPR